LSFQTEKKFNFPSAFLSKNRPLTHGFAGCGRFISYYQDKRAFSGPLFFVPAVPTPQGVEGAVGSKKEH